LQKPALQHATTAWYDRKRRKIECGLAVMEKHLGKRDAVAEQGTGSRILRRDFAVRLAECNSFATTMQAVNNAGYRLTR